MVLKKEYFSFLLLGVCAMGILVPGPATAKEQIPGTTEELLDYSVKDLQDRMQELTETNTSLRQKSDSLRNRVLFLRQEMRDLDNKKIQWMEEATQLRDAIKLGGQGQDVGKNRFIQAKEKKGYLIQEQQTLQKQLASREARQKELQDQAEQSQKALRALQSEREKSAGTANQQVKEGKIRFRKMLIEVAEKIEAEQRQVKTLQNHLAAFNKEKDVLAQANQSLKEKLLQAQGTMQLALDREKSLQSAGQQSQAARQKVIGQAQERISQLTENSQQFSAAVNELQQIKDKLARQAADQQKDFAGLKAALLEQKQLLVAKKDLAQKAVDLAKNPSGASAQKIEAQNKTLQAQAQDIRKQADAIRQKIAQEQQKQSGFALEEKKVLAEIKPLQEKSSAAKSARLSGADRKKSEVSKQLAAQNQKNNSLQKEIVSVRAKLVALQGAQDSHREKKDSLAKDLQALTAKVSSLDDAAARLRGNSKTLQSQQGQGANQTREERQTLEFRKAALGNSILLIQSRYDSESAAVKEFHKEKPQLEEYLRVLKIENQGLKEKAQELQTSVEAKPEPES